MPLSNDQIEILRTQYLRDKWVAAVAPSTPAIAISHYNAANRKVFIDDTRLQALAASESLAYSDELGGVYEDEYDRRVARGESTAAADTAATALQQDAFFRIIRAAVREQMMGDPGFSESIADNDQRSSLFKTWEKQIIKDRQFTRSRTTAPFRSLPLERY